MSNNLNLEDIRIRTGLLPGDIGYIIYMHGHLYQKEYGYGIQFDIYVAMGLIEFFKNYDSNKDRVWICEHNNKIIGSLLLVHRDETAQLRYFILDPEYRGIGLGKKLMNLYMDFLKDRNYKSSFLWTTHELSTAANLYTRYGFRLTEEKNSDSFGKSIIEQRYDLFLK